MTMSTTGAVFLAQAGIWLLACVGFLFIFWTQRSHGHVEFSELVEDTAEADGGCRRLHESCGSDSVNAWGCMEERRCA